MTLLILSSLLIIGLMLILIEVFLIPGTTVVGGLGFLSGLAGVYFAFLSYDTNTALWVSGIAGVTYVFAIWYGFTSNVWQYFALKEKSIGGVFDGRTEGLTIGMLGKTVSDIKPIGKVLIGDHMYEVKSEEGFIEVGKEVKIVKIENNKIIVK